MRPERVVRELVVVGVLSAPDPVSIVSVPLTAIEIDIGGVVGDRHHGVTAASDSRQARFYPRGTTIRNRRQISLVSVEELEDVADRMRLPEVRPEWLGANVIVEGLADLSALAPGSRFLFTGGVGLVCEGVNQPCRLPARVLQRVYPHSQALTSFGREAFGRRGVVASVERTGVLVPGEHARIHAPEPHLTLT